MKLQQPPLAYNRMTEVQRNRSIEQADAENHKRNRDVEIGQGRLILTDTVTGDRYSLTVASGSVTLVAL